MSELSKGSARLLRDARELLGPEPDTLSTLGRALQAKLQAGASLSCGELEPEQFSGQEHPANGHAARAWRSLFGTRVIGVAVCLLGVGATAYFGLSARQEAQLARSADVPQPLAAVGAVTEPRLSPLADRVAAVAPPSSRAQHPSAASTTAQRKRNLRVAARAGVARSAPALNAVGESGAATTPVASSGMIQPAIESRHAVEAHVTSDRNLNPRAASAEPVSPERDLLVREVAMIETARAALERGDQARALAFLDAHAREFPRGTLTEEQLALRARALCASGRFEAGREAVRRLAARGPQSPHLRNSVAACDSAK